MSRSSATAPDNTPGIFAPLAQSTFRGIWIGGTVSNGVAGVAILGHPTNFRAPEPMRLNPTEPFFSFAPQQLGEFSIPPGGTHVARYRILVADGPPDAAALERQWSEWSQVP